MRQRHAARIEDPGQIRIDHFRPLLRAHVGDVGEHTNPGVVDEDVQSAKASDGRGNGALDVGILANIRAQRFDRRWTGALYLPPGL